jgi:hypothetical protein
MSVILEKSVLLGIPAHEMRVGQVGVITAWGAKDCIGTVVQRCSNDRLVEVGGIREWETVLGLSRPYNRVHVLPNDTVLIIKNNEQ